MTKRVNFGSLVPAQAAVGKTIKPLDKFATLELLENYLIYIKRYSTINRKACMQVASWLLNNFDLSVIDMDKAREIEESLRERGLKPRTIIRKLNGLVLISEALGKPIKITYPKAVKEQKQGLTLVEGRALLAAADNVRDRALISFMLTTGCRLKEIQAARLSDLNLRERYFTVRAHDPTETVKNKKEFRAVLTKAASEDLARWIEIRGELDHDFIFVNQWGKPITRGGIQKVVYAIAKKAGIEKKVSPHRLRAFCASALLKSGVDVYTVMRQLNHSSLASTLVYLTASDEERKEAIDKRFVL
jgi:integrase